MQQDSVAEMPRLTTIACALVAGATITIEIKDEDYGGRGYSCRDPQGQLWNFGSYDLLQDHA
jgi:uncharacterized glyoxalase superfamily protein PhnB